MVNPEDVEIRPSSHSQISMLHDDALWRIFVTNADMDSGMEPHPLDITRYTSQVCHHWRDLIIGSASIWGGLIELDLFKTQKTDQWRNEVMRRTAQSLLSVRGSLISDDASKTFFHYLLTDHWSRIRNINVRIAQDLFEDPLWDIFWEKSAPNLEEFSVNYTHNPGPMEQKVRREGLLFSNQAPLLRGFHCITIHFDYRTSWISQLRSLTLSSPLTVPDALNLLSQLSRLEEVFIDHGVIPIVDHLPRRPKITLPNLKHIQAQNTLRTCLAVLEHIIPAPTCELLLMTNDTDRTNVTGADISALRPLVSHYAESHFSSTSVTAFILGISSGRFCALPFFPDRVRVVPPVFGINISCNFTLPPESCALLLRAFLACRFVNITTFDFVPTSSWYIKPEDSTLAAFIQILPSVETLSVTEYGVKVLNNVSIDNALMFPALRTVNLRFLSRATLKFPDTLILFLSRRKRAGVPVGVFDISHWAIREGMHWSFLDVIGGLRVVWEDNGTVEEYICGSGMQERLNLRTLKA